MQAPSALESTARALLAAAALTPDTQVSYGAHTQSHTLSHECADTPETAAWSVVLAAQRQLHVLVSQLAAEKSIYRRALGRGVQELLDDFSAHLVTVDRECVCDHTLTPTYVLYACRHYLSLLPDVVGLVEQVRVRDMTPAQLLNTLHDREQLSAAEHKIAFQRLRFHAHQPFFALLTRWMAYGEVDSFSDDFFVKRHASAAALASAKILPSAGVESDILRDLTEDDAAATQLLRYLNAEYEWTQGFELDATCLPTSYVPVHVAEAVLATGRAVRILRAATVQDIEAMNADPESGMVPPTRTMQPPVGGAAGETESVGAVNKWQFTREDEANVCRLLSGLRHAQLFSSIAFSTIVEKLRELAMQRLWRLLVHEGAYLMHARALRHYMLIGRGDLFQAFLERLRLTNGSTPSSAQLMSGPWLAAAAAVGIRGESYALSWLTSNLDRLASGILHRGAPTRKRNLHRDMEAAVAAGESDDGSDDNDDVIAPDVGGENDPCFDRVHLDTRHKALRWIAPAFADASMEPHDSALSRGSTVLRARRHADVMRHWLPPATSVPGASAEKGVDHRWMRASRAEGSVTTVGAASLREVHALTSTLDDVGADASTAQPVNHLFLTHSGTRGTASSAGALWLTQSLPLAAGFCVRACVSLHYNAFQHSAGEDSAELPGSTSTFAFVIQRQHLLACGQPTLHGADSIPGAGYAGIDQSLVLQILCKRLPEPLDHTSDGASRSIVKLGSRFRLVAALYGRPQAARAAAADDGMVSLDGRTLLASGVIMEHELSVDSTYIDSAADVTACAASLHFMVHYVPPSAEGGDAGRLRVHVLDIASLMPAGLNARNGSNATDASLADARRTSLDSTSASATTAFTHASAPAGIRPSAVASASRSLLDAALDLNEIIDFAHLRAPGRYRAWIGLTSEHHSGADSAVYLPHVSVESLDVAVAADIDDAHRALVLDYRVPWPLHVLLTPVNMGSLQDVFSLLLHVKQASLALKDAWSTLMDSFSLSESTGITVLSPASTSGAGRTLDGVSAQVQGLGGKRAADPRVHQRTRMRIAVHRLLTPVWLLRSQLAAAVDGLMYHFQVDVVESAFTGLVDAIRDSSTFDGLLKAHNEFIFRLVDGCWLSHPAVLACVERILRVADRFTSLLQASSKNLSALLQPDKARPVLAELATSFKTETRLLLQLLSTSSGEAGESLVARFSFNEYFAA